MKVGRAVRAVIVPVRHEIATVQPIPVQVLSSQDVKFRPGIPDR